MRTRAELQAEVEKQYHPMILSPIPILPTELGMLLNHLRVAEAVITVLKQHLPVKDLAFLQVVLETYDDTPKLKEK